MGPAIRVDLRQIDSTANTTVHDTMVRAQNAGDPEIRFRTGVFGRINGSLFGNTLDGGSGEITFDASGGGTINITQLDPAVNSANSLDEANGIPQGNVNASGTVNDNQPPPPLP